MSSSACRVHTQTVRLTEGQHVLARSRMAQEPGMSWQKLLTATVNAYANQELHVSPTGALTIGAPRESAEDAPAGGSPFCADDDPEAVDLDDLDEGEGPGSLPAATSRPYGTQTERTLGTRELAALAEEQTGRAVNLKLLRQLIRERFHEGETGPATRYRWVEGDPLIERIIQAIGQGALDELRDRRLTEAALGE